MDVGRKGSRIPVSEIEGTLFHYCPELSGFFICGEMAMFWGQLGETVHPFAVVIEEDSLATACVDYLKAHGVPEYASAADIPSAPTPAP